MPQVDEGCCCQDWNSEAELDCSWPMNDSADIAADD